jgi:hypothetical protein
MNKIEDFVVQVENGRRKKILAGRTNDSSYSNNGVVVVPRGMEVGPV